MAIRSGKAGCTTAAFVEASTAVVAAAIAENIVRAFGVDHWRNCLGIAVGAKPVGSAYLLPVRVACVVSRGAVVALHAAYIAVGPVEIRRTAGLTAYAISSIDKNELRNEVFFEMFE